MIMDVSVTSIDEVVQDNKAYLRVSTSGGADILFPLSDGTEGGKWLKEPTTDPLCAFAVEMFESVDAKDGDCGYAETFIGDDDCPRVESDVDSGSIGCDACRCACVNDFIERVEVAIAKRSEVL